MVERSYSLGGFNHSSTVSLYLRRCRRLFLHLVSVSTPLEEKLSMSFCPFQTGAEGLGGRARRSWPCGRMGDLMGREVSHFPHRKYS